VTNKNASQARIYGLDLGFSYAFNKHWETTFDGTYTVGQDIESSLPLAHIPPLFGRIGLSFSKQKLKSSLDLRHNVRKNEEDIAPGRTDNPNEGLNGEFPAWTVVNARLAYQISKSVHTQVSVENILDQHYKAFASGLSAPGRNFILSLRYSL